ncbi:unnamed protein product [Phaeothamnion confervicola]
MYGQAGMVLIVVNAHFQNQRYANQVLTAFKKDSSRVEGGYLCVDGQGHTLTFTVHRVKPVIKTVLIRTWTVAQLAAARRGKTTAALAAAAAASEEQTHHNLPWEDGLTFVMPEQQVRTADLAERARQPVVVLTLTNGSRATLFTRDILNLPKREFSVLATGGTERGSVFFRCDTEVLQNEGARAGLLGGLGVELPPPGQPRGGGPVSWATTALGLAAGRPVATAAAFMVAAAAATAALAPALLMSAVALAGAGAYWLLPRWLACECLERAAVPRTRGVQVSIIPLRWEQAPDLPTEESFSAAADGGGCSVGGSSSSGGCAADEDGEFIVDPTTGLPPMPRRFLLAELGDYRKALARWQQTLTWRAQEGVDAVLDEPYELFDVIKSFYFHCFHLPDRFGNLTYYEKPALMNWEGLRAYGIQKDELIRHCIYTFEYLWQRLQPRQTQKLTMVLDLEGVRMRDFAGEGMALLKSTVSMMSAHYPQRSFKILILNAPATFNLIFAGIRPLLAEHTRQKIAVLSPAAAAKGLLEVVDTANLPREYGGTCIVPLGESAYEQRTRQHVQHVLSSAGRKMRQIGG